MKTGLLPLLRCPCCGSGLGLHAVAQRAFDIPPIAQDRLRRRGEAADLATAVETGVLACEARCSWHPIINFVPVLLDFAIPLHEEFRRRHPGAPDVDLPLPPGAPRDGELDIQRSFTVEWSGLGEDQFTFVFSLEQRQAHLRAELDWPQSLLSRPAGDPPLLVLDVGAGFGLEPGYIHDATGGPDAGAEVVGIDLNLSLLQSGRNIAAKPFVHTVIASLFAPPFAERTFDLVYSNGVIHHTYSTRAALQSIERFRKPDGTIYTWVYASEDFFQLSWKGQVQHVLEGMFRPGFSRLPPAVQNIFLYPLAYRNLRVGRHAMNRGKEWTLKNALHETRDRWTPRYAHRHRFNEVLRWYSDLGLEARPVDPAAIQKHLPIPIIGIGVRGRSKAGDGVARRE